MPSTSCVAVVLLSGGLDSATAAAWAKSVGFDLIALTIDYGQRHRCELDAAKRVAESLGVARHIVVPLPQLLFGDSALTSEVCVPKDVPRDQIGSSVPATYVPARNTIFLSLALAVAETHGATDIVIGVNAVDYSGYPDCRDEYLRAFERLACLATKAGDKGAAYKVHSPLQTLTKSEIIRAGMAWGVDYSLTHSCYDPVCGVACGHCEACILRRAGFDEAGIADPASR
ncbi:MAG: 7-cyano-7-deazaguanine synthase QueC [Thermoguttaceae bacterium]